MAFPRTHASLFASLAMTVTTLTGCNASSDRIASDRIAKISAHSVKAQTGIDPQAVKAEIWQKELAIFEGRSRGDSSYYVENASPNFLAWTSGTTEPFGIEGLIRGGEGLIGQDQEITKLTMTGFSLSGDTAISYFQNHRTRKPDGTVVDQTYDNIHVWQKTDGEWKVLASKSRLAEF